MKVGKPLGLGHPMGKTTAVLKLKGGGGGQPPAEHLLDVTAAVGCKWGQSFWIALSRALGEFSPGGSVLLCDYEMPLHPQLRRICVPLNFADIDVGEVGVWGSDSSTKCFARVGGGVVLPSPQCFFCFEGVKSHAYNWPSNF